MNRPPDENRHPGMLPKSRYPKIKHYKTHKLK